MRLRILIVGFFFLAPIMLPGQTKVVKFSIYFESDKFQLQESGEQTIAETLDTLQQYIIKGIYISGNADNTSDSLHNLKLSEKRAETIKNFILNLGFKENLIKADYYGEDKPIAPNDLEEGRKKNRRVDIVVAYKLKSPPKQKVVADIIPPLVVKGDTCKKDTIIILPEGTQMVFNLCEYLEIKDCLDFIETNNPQSILANGFSLMDTSGIPIASCGMLKITLKPGCTERKCFKVPVKVRFPVPKDKDCNYCGRNARVWDITSNGRWMTTVGKKSDMKIISLKGQQFYQFTMYCPNYSKNCDCKTKGKRLKIKTNHKYRFIDAKIAFDCPTAVIVLKPKSRKNVVKTKVPCWKGNKTIMATLINDKGDTLYLLQQSLNDLPKRTAFSGCRKIYKEFTGKKLGIFSIPKRELYRKYIIDPDLLVTKKEK